MYHGYKYQVLVTKKRAVSSGNGSMCCGWSRWSSCLAKNDQIGNYNFVCACAVNMYHTDPSIVSCLQTISQCITVKLCVSTQGGSLQLWSDSSEAVIQLVSMKSTAASRCISTMCVHEVSQLTKHVPCAFTLFGFKMSPANRRFLKNTVPVCLCLHFCVCACVQM